MRNSPPRAYLLLRQSLNETGAAGRPNVPPLRRTTDLSEGRREGQLPIPSGSSGHLPLIRGGGLPYGSRENLPGLGRGAPWGSRADVVHTRSYPHPSGLSASHLPPDRGKAFRRPKAAPKAEHKPGALARQSQAQKMNRSGTNFCKPRARWPGGDLDTHSNFARRK